jgi:hypothetical protein
MEHTQSIYLIEMDVKYGLNFSGMGNIETLAGWKYLVFIITSKYFLISGTELCSFSQPVYLDIYWESTEPFQFISALLLVKSRSRHKIENNQSIIMNIILQCYFVFVCFGFTNHEEKNLFGFKESNITSMEKQFSIFLAMRFLINKALSFLVFHKCKSSTLCFESMNHSKKS